MPETDEQTEVPHESRAHRALKASIEKTEREIAETRRETALFKSGVDLESGPGKLFVKTLPSTGEIPTPEELRAQARFYGIPMKGETPARVNDDE